MAALVHRTDQVVGLGSTAEAAALEVLHIGLEEADLGSTAEVAGLDSIVAVAGLGYKGLAEDHRKARPEEDMESRSPAEEGAGSILVDSLDSSVVVGCSLDCSLVVVVDILLGADKASLIYRR